jgi:hypothetical protein
MGDFDYLQEIYDQAKENNHELLVVALLMSTELLDSGIDAKVISNLLIQDAIKHIEKTVDARVNG